MALYALVFFVFFFFGGRSGWMESAMEHDAEMNAA